MREKHLPFAEAAALAMELHAALSQAHATTRVMLSAPLEPVSPEAWPDGIGIHLSTAALPAWQHTRSFGRLLPLGMVSASCHSVEEARSAARVASLLVFAPVFEKRVRGDRVRDGSGLALLADVCRAVAPVPVLAMGGVDWGNAHACLEAGAVGVAGIRLFLQNSGMA